MRLDKGFSIRERSSAATSESAQLCFIGSVGSLIGPSFLAASVTSAHPVSKVSASAKHLQRRVCSLFLIVSVSPLVLLSGLCQVAGCAWPKASASAKDLQLPQQRMFSLCFTLLFKPDELLSWLCQVALRWPEGFLQPLRQIFSCRDRGRATCGFIGSDSPC